MALSGKKAEKIELIHDKRSRNWEEEWGSHDPHAQFNASSLIWRAEDVGS